MNENELVKRDPFRVTPIIPKDYEEVFKMAALMAKTDMVPKDFRGKTETIVVAIQLGLELGLLPMQALQNIAVINGRPCIWGDAQLALVRASGHMEWMKETQNDISASCEVKRYGDPNPVKQTFSKADAERAGLWKKSGPWTQYPKRMLQMRARGFALRDLFPDVLKGIYSREEVQDIIDTTVVASPAKTKRAAIPATGSSDDNLDALKDAPAPMPAEVPGIADERAVPPDDDIPIDETPEGPELVTAEELSAFLGKSRALGLTTKTLVEFVKKNGFSEASKITKAKYELMLQGLDEKAEK